MSVSTVSVLIVSYNVKQYLGQAVRALQRSNYSGKIEIIIVDNNSYDGTSKYITREFPDTIMIPNSKNLGFGKAVNQAAAQATGEYLLILNPDTVVQENTIATFMEYLQGNPNVGLLGPKILNADGSLQLACKRSFPSAAVAIPKLLGLNRIFKRARWANRYNLTYLDPDEIHPVDAVSGSCMFLPTELFRSLAGFDERFFMFGEDLDICYRVKQAGYEIHYLPQTQIIHYKGESVKTAPFDSLNAFYNAMILFSEKHFSVGQSLFVKLGIRLGIGFRKIGALLTGRKSQFISVFFDALSVLTAFLIAIPLKFGDFEPIAASKGLVPLIYVVFWLLVAAVFQLYSRYILSYSRAILASLAGFLLAVAFTYFFKQYAFSRFVILAATMLVSIFLPGWRMIVHFLISRGWFRPVKSRQLLFARKTIIVGTDEEGQRIGRKLIKRFDTGLEIIGFCDDDVSNPDELPLPFIGKLEDIREIVNLRGVRELIFSSGELSNERILRIMEMTRDLNLTYRMVPRKQDILLGKALVEDIGDFSFINIEYPLFRSLHFISKRVFDLVAAGLLGIVMLPVITIYRITGNIKKVEFWGPDGTKFEAEFITAKGRFVRHLPLLWQVVIGKMSVVGASLVNTANVDPQIMFRPGLTGLDRIRKINYTSEDRRLLNHYYLQHQTFTLDLEIIMKSVFGN